jgi:TPR repeat protein
MPSEDDRAEAIKWLLMAVEPGLRRAQSKLAELYGNGHGPRPPFPVAEHDI